jgi:hypothetical protein
MKHAGATAINDETDKALLERWMKSNLWPVTAEESAHVIGTDGRQSFWHFCPEVMFDRFGLFVSDAGHLGDEIDVESAHRRLSQEGAGGDDWRWVWSYVRAEHYTECRFYSILSAQHSVSSAPLETPAQKPRELVQIKPGAFGVSFDLKALITRLAKWWLDRTSA